MRESNTRSVLEWSEGLAPLDKEKIRHGELPVILRGYASHWALVKLASGSFDDVAAYLSRFDCGMKFEAMIAPVSAGKRLFYNDDLTGFNFDRMVGSLDEALKIFKVMLLHDPSPSFYIGSVSVSDYFPQMKPELPMDLFSEQVEPKIWISNKVTVSIHNDDAENIACVAAGRRRFTLFPPNQEENLYIAKTDISPAGRPISLVDLKQPDLTKYPRFKTALDNAVVAELMPGDAVYIPRSWWHNVESLDAFNVLINFWSKEELPCF